METQNKIIDVFFNGKNGYRIEGSYYHQANLTSPSVIIAPPDPRYGGNIKNQIIKILMEVFIECGFSVLAINYRGIGKSEGTFKSKEDAVEDISIALDWLEQQNKQSSYFWIAGYSFGGWVASNIAIRRPDIETFVLVSPLIKNYNFDFIFPSLCGGGVFCGDSDEFYSVENAISFVDKMNESKQDMVKLVFIKNAGHLYKDCTRQLKKELTDFINIKVATRIAKPVRKKRRRRKKKDSFF